MPTLIDNLNLINSYKSDIKSAIEDKGVDMTGVPFSGYASKIGEIETGGTFVTETLSVSQNGTYYPGQGVDGFSQVDVNVPQSVEGYTEKDITEKEYNIVTLSNSASTVGSYCFDGNSYLNTVYLPNCETVNRNAFRDCVHLEQVDMPLCKVINTYAFQRCYILKTVSLPLCERIESWGFAYCSSITYINLPTCLYVEQYAFAYTGLSAVSLPLVSYIGNYTFNNCTVLKELTLCTETYNMPGYQNRMFSYTGSFMTNGSIYVASDMYSRWIVSTGWSSLESRFVSVNQAGPVLSFSDGVVSGITRYLNTTWSTYLGKSKADVVELSLSSITKIDSTFSQFQNLTRVSLPACSYLGAYAFERCTSLSYVYIPECKKIEACAFQRCTSLNYISAPECSSIVDYAIESCYLLSSISLPLCEYIGRYAFCECSSLERVDLSVCSYIGSYAFYNCRSLSEVILGYSSVCQIDNTTFINMTWSIFKIYVPSSLVDSYKTAYWDWGYSSLIFPIPE